MRTLGCGSLRARLGISPAGDADAATSTAPSPPCEGIAVLALRSPSYRDIRRLSDAWTLGRELAGPGAACAVKPAVALAFAEEWFVMTLVFGTVDVGSSYGDV